MRTILRIGLSAVVVTGLLLFGHSPCAAGEDNAEEAAYRATDYFSVESLQSFLNRFPNGRYADNADLGLALLKRLALIKGGKVKPALVIPFEVLGPRWEGWKKRVPERGCVGYFLHRVEGGWTMGFFAPIGFPKSVSFDEYATLCSATGDGSIVGFQTEGREFEYLNGIVMRCSANNIMYFAVVGDLGLVYLHGQGDVRLPKMDKPHRLGYDSNDADSLRLLRSEDQLDRAGAAQALGWTAARGTDKDRIASALIAVLANRAAGVRRDAADALGRIGARAALEPLKQAAAKEQDEWAKAAMQEAARKLEG